MNPIKTSDWIWEGNVPPVHYTSLVGGWDGVGQDMFDFISLFESFCDLTPNDRVLDVGCGCGRFAVYFTKYLKEGIYEGLDIHKGMINWCKENITDKYKNFNFSVVDVCNKYYNNQGNLKPEDYIFPYKDEEFDFVFLTSVFTHMLYKDIKHYLDELYRVVRPGKKVYISFFILNKESLAHMEQKHNVESFKSNFTQDEVESKVSNIHIPEAAVAYYEEDILSLIKNSKFKMYGIHYGCWSSNKIIEVRSPIKYQDILILEK